MTNNYTITAEVGSELPHVRVEFTFNGNRSYAFLADTPMGWRYCFMWEGMSLPGTANNAHAFLSICGFDSKAQRAMILDMATWTRQLADVR